MGYLRAAAFKLEHLFIYEDIFVRVGWRGVHVNVCGLVYVCVRVHVNALLSIHMNSCTGKVTDKRTAK